MFIVLIHQLLHDYKFLIELIITNIKLHYTPLTYYR